MFGVGGLYHGLLPSAPSLCAGFRGKRMIGGTDNVNAGNAYFYDRGASLWTTLIDRIPCLTGLG